MYGNGTQSQSFWQQWPGHLHLGTEPGTPAYLAGEKRAARDHRDVQLKSTQKCHWLPNGAQDGTFFSKTSSQSGRKRPGCVKQVSFPFPSFHRPELVWQRYMIHAMYANEQNIGSYSPTLVGKDSSEGLFKMLVPGSTQTYWIYNHKICEKGPRNWIFNKSSEWVSCRWSCIKCSCIRLSKF